MRSRFIRPAALGLLVLLALPFVIYAADFGLRGLAGRVAGQTYLHTPGRPGVNGALFLHMLLGAGITLLAPVQLIGAVRRRWPAWHRGAGRFIAGAGMVTGLGGLIFIATRGTIGGWPMDLGFASYGALMVLCSAQTFRHARARRIADHRRWAVRLFVLAMASWLYRVQYGIWYAATGGLASYPDFSGAFDLTMNWAFFLPWLILAEVLRRRYQ